MESYKRYLIHQLREHLGFEHTPSGSICVPAASRNSGNDHDRAARLARLSATSRLLIGAQYVIEPTLHSARADARAPGANPGGE